MRTILWSVALAASSCAPPPDAWVSSAAPPPQPGPILRTLRLEQVDLAVPGEPVTWHISHAAPYQTVALIRSLIGEGSGGHLCPAALNHNCVDMLGGSLVGLTSADGAGAADVSLSLPGFVADGDEVWLQAAAGRSGGVYPNLSPVVLLDAFDMDADGRVTDEDCNDEDPTVYVASPELCNGLDDDCNGVIDDDDQVLGDGAACAAVSCLAILDARGPLADGPRWLAGSGGSPVQATCDMTGGGWTRLGQGGYGASGDVHVDVDGLGVPGTQLRLAHVSGATQCNTSNAVQNAWAACNGNTDGFCGFVVLNGGGVVYNAGDYASCPTYSGATVSGTAAFGDRTITFPSTVTFASSVQVWYHEDYFNYSEGDNGGVHTVALWAR